MSLQHLRRARGEQPQHQQLCTRLLIGADGHNSPVRQYASIRTFGHDYNQRGLVGTLRCRPGTVGHTAHQRFLPSGPIAFLPVSLSHPAPALVFLNEVIRLRPSCSGGQLAPSTTPASPPSRLTVSSNTVKVQVKVLSITLPGVASNDNHGEDDSLFGGGSDSGIARNQTLPITNGNGEGTGVAGGVNDGDFSQDTDDDDRPLQGRRATTANRTNRPLELVPDPNLVRWFVERMPQATALLGTDVGPRAGFLLPSMGLVHSSGPPNFTCVRNKTPVAPAALVISCRSHPS
ncbi:unnamed protein product [Tilletia controversa]|nr:unnamed protein product [Tilletia controversa]